MLHVSDHLHHLLQGHQQHGLCEGGSRSLQSLVESMTNYMVPQCIAALGIVSLAAFGIVSLAALGFISLAAQKRDYSAWLLITRTIQLGCSEGLFSLASQREDYSTVLPRDRKNILLCCQERGLFSLVAPRGSDYSAWLPRRGLSFVGHIKRQRAPSSGTQTLFHVGVYDARMTTSVGNPCVPFTCNSFVTMCTSKIFL